MSNENIAITSAIAEMTENTKLIGDRVSQFTNENESFHSKLIDQMKQIVQNITELKNNPSLPYIKSYEETTQKLKESQLKLQEMTENNTQLEKQMDELKQQLQTSQEENAKLATTASANNTQLNKQLEECNNKLQQAQQNFEAAQNQSTTDLQQAKDQLSQAQSDLQNIQQQQQQQVTEAQQAQKLAQQQLIDSQQKLGELQTLQSSMASQIMDVKDQIKQQLDNINQMVTNSQGYNTSYDNNLMQITNSLTELMNLIANPPSSPFTPPSPSSSSPGSGAIPGPKVNKKSSVPLTNVNQLKNENYQKFLGGKHKHKNKTKHKGKHSKTLRKGGYSYSTTQSYRSTRYSSPTKHKRSHHYSTLKK
uniref:Uncharacterized protein n=1 Tax=viral metagenome TaxID=1070528 RepID=A0A6C0E5U4_9ZZZZ